MQGVRYTKAIEPVNAESENNTNNQHYKRHDIFVAAYDMKNTMYIDQTGKF